MKILVACCLLVGVLNAAEVDFKQRGNPSASGRPISVPVIQQRQSGQRINSNNKRQVDVGTAGRPVVNTAAFRQQQSGVPLQQAFRPSSQAARQGTASAPAAPSRPEPSADSEDNESLLQQRSNPASSSGSFVEQKPQQAFVPFARENAEAREGAQPARRPARPARPASFNGQGEAPASRGNPEFERGFPDGFTSGLPAFDFQGRMPEPDEKSEGFMDGALHNFPNLKSFGGFDAMPEVAREDSVGPPVKRTGSSFPGSGRPSGSRPSSQLTGFRPSAE